MLTFWSSNISSNGFARMLAGAYSRGFTYEWMKGQRAAERAERREMKKVYREVLKEMGLWAGGKKEFYLATPRSKSQPQISPERYSLATVPRREREIARKGRAKISSFRAAETGSWVENKWQSYPAAQKRNGGLRGSRATRWG